MLHSCAALSPTTTLWKSTSRRATPRAFLDLIARKRREGESRKINGETHRSYHRVTSVSNDIDLGLRAIYICISSGFSFRGFLFRNSLLEFRFCFRRCTAPRNFLKYKNIKYVFSGLAEGR